MVLSLLLSATPANADITPWIAASLHDPAKWDTAGLYTATPWLLPSVDSRRWLGSVLGRGLAQQAGPDWQLGDLRFGPADSVLRKQRTYPGAFGVTL